MSQSFRVSRIKLIRSKLSNSSAHVSGVPVSGFVSPATRARQRAVRLVFAMFVTFFICWTPFLVYVLLYQLATTTHDNGVRTASQRSMHRATTGYIYVPAAETGSMLR